MLGTQKEHNSKVNELVLDIIDLYEWFFFLVTHRVSIVFELTKVKAASKDVMLVQMPLIKS